MTYYEDCVHWGNCSRQDIFTYFGQEDSAYAVAVTCDECASAIMEKYNNGATYEDRDQIYAEMAEILAAKGINSEWFSVASDLMEFAGKTDFHPGKFSDTLDWLNSFPAFARDLSSYLLSENAKVFDLLISGQIDLNGKDLDYYLVEREQTFVESYIYIADMAPLNGRG